MQTPLEPAGPEPMDWVFRFEFADFSLSFLSILFEGLPFLLLGTVLSGLIDQFLPARLMTRLLPRNAYAGVAISGALGAVFPMCECGVVPVIRRLMGKGLPVSNAIAYMLAAPIVNPIVAISTYAAFQGQDPLRMTVLRLGIGYLVAVIVGAVVHRISIGAVLRPAVVAEVVQPRGLDAAAGGGVVTRLWRALGIAVGDFLNMTIYFVLGCAAAAVFNTAVNQEVIVPLAFNDSLATISLMALAGILCLCSTSDAFVAASFVIFPQVAKIAFMVFGPMVDLKLLFMYSSVFRPKFLAGMVVGLFVLIALICIRLNVIFTFSDQIP
jgi:Predicted permeases